MLCRSGHESRWSRASCESSQLSKCNSGVIEWTEVDSAVDSPTRRPTNLDFAITWEPQARSLNCG